MKKIQKSGITIVTLVITIIILTVLTGTVMLTMNNTDIFGQTKNTVDEHNKQAIIEQINLEIETEMIKKVNEKGRYEQLSKEETINIINKYGTYEEDTLKLTTREKNIPIYLYEILEIKVEEYVTAVYKDKQFTLTEKEENLSSNGYKYEYTFDNGLIWQTYTSPITIQEQSGIKVRLVNSEGQVISNEYVVTKGAGEETVNKIKQIAVTNTPTKTTYKQGETFNPSGITITVTYEDNTSKVVTNYNYTPTRALIVSDRYVTISYTENGVTKQTTQSITVTNKLTAIGITNLGKTKYKQGEIINKEDIEVTALYEDNTTKPVTNFTYEPTGELTTENTKVTVTYTEDGITKTTSKDIQVTYASVLEITSEPEVEFKTTYIKGEDFDPTGLMVTVIYEDGNALPITNYEIVNGENLQVGTTEIVIRYTEGGITLEKGIPITVTNNVTGIEVTTLPNKTTYNHNEEFDKIGMVVIVTYQNNETKELEENEYTVSTPTYGQNYVTITHIETGLTTTQAITVNRVLANIEITTSPTLTYNYGETFSTNGMVVTATYTDSEIAEEITGYTTSPLNGATLDHSNTTLTVTYEGKTDTKAMTINKVLSNIAITTNPTLTYNYGGTFSTAGMVVTATYSDNSTADVTSSCTTSPVNGATLDHSHTALTVTYQEKTDTKAMTINKTVSRIAVTTAPTKTTYAVGEKFSTSGMVVTATYSDNSIANVTSSCSYNPTTSTALTKSHTSITISYTYNGTTKTTSQPISVILYLYSYGNQYTSVTGGWNASVTISAWNSGMSSPNQYQATLNTSDIYFKRVGGSGSTGYIMSIRTVNKINITQYKTLKVRYKINQVGIGYDEWSEGILFGLSGATSYSALYKGTNNFYENNSHSGFVNSAGTFVKDVDLSNETGEQYVVAMSVGYDYITSNYTPEAYIYEIWLE